MVVRGQSRAVRIAVLQRKGGVSFGEKAVELGMVVLWLLRGEGGREVCLFLLRFGTDVWFLEFACLDSREFCRSVGLELFLTAGEGRSGGLLDDSLLRAKVWEERGFCSLGGEREGRCGRVLFGGKSSCA